jgi:glycerol-3-phosphate dehydrogenase
VAVSDSGVVTITGGKLTTYREMAADTVDVVIERLRSDGRDGFARWSRTKHLPLRGADGYADVATEHPHLAGRYGGESRILLAMVERDASLGEPLVEGLPYLRAEALYAARYEMARTVDDVLSRRTRARLLARDASTRAAADVAALVGDELGWSADERAAQAADYCARADHDRDAAGLPCAVAKIV